MTKELKTIIAPLSMNLLANLSTEDLRERGHVPVGITICANRKKSDSNKTTVCIPIPKEIGSGKPGIGKNFGRRLSARRFIETMVRVPPIQIKTLSNGGLELLKEFVKTEQAFNNMSFFVQELVTQHVETEKFVTWRRRKIKNGSNSKALIIDKIDDVEFAKLKYRDIVEVADDMVYDACVFEQASINFVSPECTKH